MKYLIGGCSPQAREKIKSEVETDDSFPSLLWAKYPFGQLKIGQCFAVPFEVGKEKSLRALATQQKAKTGKVFTVIKHTELKIFEVARVG